MRGRARERVCDKVGESEFRLHAPHLSRSVLNGIERRGRESPSKTGEINKNKKKGRRGMFSSECWTLAEPDDNEWEVFLSVTLLRDILIPLRPTTSEYTCFVGSLLHTSYLRFLCTCFFLFSLPSFFTLPSLRASLAPSSEMLQKQTA